MLSTAWPFWVTVVAGKPECENSSMFVTPLRWNRRNRPSSRSRWHAAVVAVRHASETPVIAVAFATAPPFVM